MKQLQLGKDLSLPLEAVTETFALLAVRGAGKSNAARVMAEEMFAAKLPFVAVDPVGSWYGLRAGRDGGAGLPIPIFGGRHGDMPLERGAGQLVADLVVDQRLSCVLDLTTFDSEASKKAFLLDFARRLYLRNEAPLHLYLEEADDYIPQRPMRDELQLLRAWENIVRRGRARGLGITLITQRSASVNKSVLTQTGTLIAMRTTSPQDRGAVEEWLKYHGGAREILESLSGLEAGEAWVWSPQFMRTTVRVRFRMSRTLDSGATPKSLQGTKAPATMADVDLGAIQKRMAATIERAKADDPKELRKRIAELERQVAAKPAAAPAQKVEVPIILPSALKRLEAAAEKLLAAGDALAQKQQVVITEVGMLRGEIARAWARQNQFHEGIPARGGAAAVPRMPKDAPVADSGGAGGRRGSSATPPPVRSSVDTGEQRILDTVAELVARDIPRTVEAIARWQGLHPNGGRFRGALRSLQAAGYLEGLEPTLLGATAGKVSAVRGPGGVVAALKDATCIRVFEELCEVRTPISIEDLAGTLGVHPNGGRFRGAVRWLRVMGLLAGGPGIKPSESVWR